MKRYLPLLILLLLLAGAIARALDVPYLSGHVNDTAHMLSADAVTELEQRLTAYEDSTTNQIVLLTISSLDGEALEDYALRVAETWKLGQKGVDNGVLLLIARDDRKMRIEVGYGLEATVTDAMSSYIINDIITPLFRQGEFEAGIREGLNALMQAADGTLSPDDVSGSGDSGMEMLVFSLFWLGIVGLFTVIGLATPGCMGWFLYAFLVPFYAVPAVLLDIGGFPLGALIFLTYIIGYPLLKILLPKTAFGKRIQEKMKTMNTSRGGNWSSRGGWSSGGWSSGGGGFSSGGFSGGGGSFGGGGSSGGW
ncbi:MAG: TPM domain-containing protein [Bacteroidetes bacterium]|nr:TPM domain-containing protein [Bacteroidota bacterium]